MNIMYSMWSETCGCMASGLSWVKLWLTLDVLLVLLTFSGSKLFKEFDADVDVLELEIGLSVVNGLIMPDDELGRVVFELIRPIVVRGL